MTHKVFIFISIDHWLLLQYAQSIHDHADDVDIDELHFQIHVLKAMLSELRDRLFYFTWDIFKCLNQWSRRPLFWKNVRIGIGIGGNILFWIICIWVYSSFYYFLSLGLTQRYWCSVHPYFLQVLLYSYRTKAHI